LVQGVAGVGRLRPHGGVPDDHIELAAQRHAQPHAVAVVIALFSTVQPQQQWRSTVHIFW